MPELPEVETMAVKLDGWSTGRRIEDVRVLRQNGKYHVDGVKGQVVFGCQRRGKRLFMVFTDDLVLSIHNAMSGYWDASDDNWTFDYVEGKRKAEAKDVRVEIVLDNGRVLRFHDQRLFGSMKPMTWDAARKEIEKMGPEAIKAKCMYPSAPVLNAIDLAVIVGLDGRPIKEVLMDQGLIAGIGNIYAAESLWMSRIHPSTPANELGALQVSSLTEAIQRALNGALERNLGYDGLTIYRRKECPVGHKVDKLKIADRQTYFCPTCQERK